VNPKPPRTPTTGQGAEIVESILVAAELVLEETGLERFTTNRVAERAGVSVGSLYQYFPNKQAVLAELARRIERRSRAAIVKVLEAASELSLEQTAERVVDMMCSDIGGLVFRRALLREVPESWRAETSTAIDVEVRDRVRAALASRSDTRSGDHAVMAWVVTHAIEGLIEVAVRDEPALLTVPAFRAELVALVTCYLRRE
jgi:AcrR family transcriptional regulator